MDAAPVSEGGERIPVARDCLGAFRSLGAALEYVVRPVHGEVVGEQEDLFLIVPRPVTGQNSCRAPDLGFYPRRSCSFASSTCS
jgi:hypothetical protein